MMELAYEHDGNVYKFNISRKGEDFHVELDGESHVVPATEWAPGFIQFRFNHKNYKCTVAREGEVSQIFIDGKIFRLKRARAGAVKIEEETGDIVAPISGKVTKVWASEGMEVNKNQDLLVMEAMKMEYRVRAPANGKVLKVLFDEGDQVEIGEILVEMEREEGGE